ncbi:hypothetical protein GQ602_004671 [Ophiocordyceps camponoti-floridani]|uniref:Uncharacterized protein n=1 Tax=Ophiocordyceps camponoti-floridani TaxID=2030778 RepID=A0A8H4Q4A2_9HYPO|nr:hypothetical protein GQ602_004671 [Ophiocordyceps camponoti-floridani]
MTAEPKVEILIHISAPSTTADDVAYRQLAQAYLAFSPEHGERIATSHQEDGIRATESEPALASSLELSFRSVMDNLASPNVVAAAGGEQRVVFCSPASQISDSYPMPDRELTLASPSRVLERYLGGTGFSAESWSSSSSSSYDDEVDAVDVPSSVPDPNLGYIIPVTPVIRTAQARKRRRSPEEHEAIIPPDISHISSSPPPKSVSEPPPPKKPRPQTIPRAESLSATQSTTTTTTTTTNTLIIPLAKLERQLSSRYRPAPHPRPLNPLERGYWLFDCTAWPAQTRLDAWVFLSNYVGNGVAGWGVWCRRAPPPGHESIRFYCWALVAKHVYLLIYLASTRRVKATGAKWYDAEGKVAIEVLPNERRTS